MDGDAGPRLGKETRSSMTKKNRHLAQDPAHTVLVLLRSSVVFVAPIHASHREARGMETISQDAPVTSSMLLAR